MKYRLLWQEDFAPTADNRPNPKYWNFDLGDGSAQGIPGWGNQEREFYVEENATVRSGLTIIAQKPQLESAPDAYDGKAQWLSSKIHTAGKVTFKYGRFDFTAKVPVGGGSWPAIWMLGTNIQEVTWPHCGDNGITGAIDIAENISDAVHTFSIEWLPDQISWFADGKLYLTIYRSDAVLQGKEWPFNENFYLIINLAMCGWFAGDIVPGFDRCDFQIQSIKHFSIDGTGEVSVS